MALSKQTFYLNDQPFEIKFIEEKINNETAQFWFAAKEFAKAMGYERPDNIIHEKIDVKYRRKFIDFKCPDTIQDASLTIHPSTVFVNKAGLFQMITTSKLKNSTQLQKWVYEEVFPKIDGTFIEDAVQHLNTSEKELGVFYVVTNEQYHERNLYKIGKTINMDKRLTQLNCGRAKYDLLRLLFHSPQSIHYSDIEQDMKTALRDYQDNGEVYCVPLQIIFDNLTDILNKYRQL